MGNLPEREKTASVSGSLAEKEWPCRIREVGNGAPATAHPTPSPLAVNHRSAFVAPMDADEPGCTCAKETIDMCDAAQRAYKSSCPHDPPQENKG
jgi:hypothetical protein